jgi:hypothetical protein
MNNMRKNKSRPIVILAFGLFWAVLAQAQESINASGGDATGSGGTVAYTIGQVTYTSQSSITGDIAQGVQQAYEIFTVGISDNSFQISLSAFPNPGADNLTIQISDFNKEKLFYHLFDTQGNVINNGQVTSQQTQINISTLLPATYFISILNQENQKIKLFKIIKN